MVMPQHVFDALRPQVFPLELGQDIGEVVQSGFVPDQVILTIEGDNVQLRRTFSCLEIRIPEKKQQERYCIMWGLTSWRFF